MTPVERDAQASQLRHRDALPPVRLDAVTDDKRDLLAIYDPERASAGAWIQSDTSLQRGAWR